MRFNFILNKLRDGNWTLPGTLGNANDKQSWKIWFKVFYCSGLYVYESCQLQKNTQRLNYSTMKMKLLILAVLPFLTSINMNSQEEKNSWVQYAQPIDWNRSMAIRSSGCPGMKILRIYFSREWQSLSGWQNGLPIPLESKHAGTLHHRVPYWYKHNYISGFMGTHYPSGAVMFDYGAVELMPVVGQLKCRPEERSSSFTHITEKSKPHFYEVMLDDLSGKSSIIGYKNFSYPAIYLSPVG